MAVKQSKTRQIDVQALLGNEDDNGIGDRGSGDDGGAGRREERADVGSSGLSVGLLHTFAGDPGGPGPCPTRRD